MSGGERTMATGVDFLMEQEYPEVELREFLASYFGTKADKIWIIHSPAECPVIGPGDALCVVFYLPEGFRQVCSLDCSRGFEVDHLMRSLAKTSGVRVMVPSDDLHVYGMNLFTPEGSVEHTSVNVRALDERDIYILEPDL